MKFIIWAVIAVLVLAWLMRAKKTAGNAGARAPASADRPEAMLPCARCGLHVPASEAVRHAPGAAFCCEEHRRQTFPDV